MVFSFRRIAFAAVALAALTGPAAAQSANDYHDPEGRFSFQVPSHWRVERISASPLHLKMTGGEGAGCVWTVVETGFTPRGRERRLELLLARMGDEFPRSHLPYRVTRLIRTDRRYRIGGEAAQFYEGSYLTEEGLEGRLDVFVTFRPFGAVVLSCTHDFEQIVWPEAAEQFRLVQTSARFGGMQGEYVIAQRYRLLTGNQTVTSRGN